ncbi:MAG TPA: DUF1489 domain-containing protein [Azospirillaceae bacterium]|nr:DUF1489 domain-containing protein [Azospirillaceae bacterium]
MALHLIKLAVGITDVDHLARVQADRIIQRDGRPVVPGWTRRAPTRVDELADGGCMYWVVKGAVRCRQRLLGFETDVDGEGKPFCRILLEPQLVETLPSPRKAFQGWRYLKPADAPPDLASAGEGAAEMPPELREELRALGLL